MATVPAKKLSVLKRVRQTKKRALRNRAVRTSVKTYIKKLHEAMAEGDKEVVESALQKAVSVISTAASKGVLHRNTASRYISRLSKRANAAVNAA